MITANVSTDKVAGWLTAQNQWQIINSITTFDELRLFRERVESANISLLEYTNATCTACQKRSQSPDVQKTRAWVQIANAAVEALKTKSNWSTALLLFAAQNKQEILPSRTRLLSSADVCSDPKKRATLEQNIAGHQTSLTELMDILHQRGVRLS